MFANTKSSSAQSFKLEFSRCESDREYVPVDYVVNHYLLTIDNHLQAMAGTPIFAKRAVSPAKKADPSA